MAKKKWILVLMLLLVIVVAGATVYADVNGTTGYTIRKSVIGSGGGTSTGSNYSVAGTAGQTAVSPAAASGSYTLASGFWHSLNGYTVYLPAIINQ